MVLKFNHNYGTFLLFTAVLLSMCIVSLSVYFVEDIEHKDKVCVIQTHKKLKQRDTSITSLGTGIIYMSIVSLLAIVYIIVNHSV